MKRLLLVSLLISGMLLLAAPKPARAGVTVSVGFFHDELTPYGRWAPCAYGECWEPTGVAVGWQPYSNGEWIDTDYGWTWVSYDPWGGDPYHYGSWVWLDDDDDWAWVPGTIWSPAWVTWCWDGDDIGWAPLGPGFAFTATGFFGSPVIDPARSYVFVPGRQFLASNVSAVRLPATRNAAILPRMRSATAFRVSGGIVRNTALPVSRVERATGRTIPRRSISAARTDPRPVPRMAAHRTMRLAAPAKELRSQIGKTRTAARRPAPRTAANRAAAVKRNASAKSHSPGPRPGTRRPTQASARRPATHRAAGRSAKPGPPARASTHKPARPRPATRKPPVARPRRTETRAVERHRPAPRPAVKASSPAHAVPRARKRESASSARPVRERTPAPAARRAPVEASHPAPQPRSAARPAPEPRAPAHLAPRPMPRARPTPPPRPKEKRPGPE